MAKFHLPYHFVPWADQTERPQDTTRDEFLAGQPTYVTHDRYLPDTFNGRLICRLTTKTPIVLGGEQTGQNPAMVKNYKLNGQPAIPASSLRGLISNIAEAASNSAFRVLDTERVYSYRKSMIPNEKKLSAMGMVHEHPQIKGRYFLRGLVIPTLEFDRNSVAELPTRFSNYFPRPVLRVYLGNSHSIRRENSPHKNLGQGNFVTMRLAHREWSPGMRLPIDDWLYGKPEGRPRYLLAQRPVEPQAAMQPLPLYNPEQHLPQNHWVPGVIRALGCWPPERQAAMPNTKKHELFLPIPTDPNWPKHEIPEAVVQTFHDLCDERTEATWERNKKKPRENPLLPFEPKGTREERYGRDKAEEARIRLKHGDIVYFDVDDQGRISEISFSSIWRAKIPGTAKSFFPSALLPFNHEKETLTPADLLFGFVEDRKALKERQNENSTGDDENYNFGLALASRIQFSAAQVKEKVTVQTEPECVRKILDSPKPPSPSFYFRNKEAGTGAIRKFALNPDQHQAQGRKLYLHHKWQRGQQPWRTGNENHRLEQKARIKPISAEQTFYFHIDLQNLSADEFGMLLYALRPSDGFQHKIGMGKAIGLGSVQIEPLAYCEINRAARYGREGLSQPRYSKVISAPDLRLDLWPDRYAKERALSQNADATLLERRDSYAATVPPNVKKALELIGDPAFLIYPVSTPQVTEAGFDNEDETYEWNVKNDRSQQPQSLNPINEYMEQLPPLKTIHRA
jgi:CRISPR-associated protein (TIGR03986 family)